MSDEPCSRLSKSVVDRMERDLAAARAVAKRWERNYDTEVGANAKLVDEVERLKGLLRELTQDVPEGKPQYEDLEAEVKRLTAALVGIRDVGGQTFHEMQSERGRGEAMGRAYCAELARTTLEDGK
ncbi:MAG: hypothetical protein O7D91_17675 [Planctomycetota bacterium]|nr:hypothetical protein [Planctomycetota bacterium]